MKVSQTEVDRGCDAAYERYRAMTRREADLAFAYELQGFVKCEVERGITLNEATSAVAELLVLLHKANR